MVAWQPFDEPAGHGEAGMPESDPVQWQREQLRAHLLRAAGALGDEMHTTQDALAITRNVVVQVLTQVDLLFSSPALALRSR